MVTEKEKAKIISPPPMPQNIAHDFLAYGLFFDGGGGNPKNILTYPPTTLKRKSGLISNNEQEHHSYILDS